MHDYTEMSKYYDDIVAKYFDYKTAFTRLDELIKGPDVLEIGCGTGNVAIHLASKGFDVIGTDDSEGMLLKAKDKLAKSKYQNLQFIRQSLEDINLNEKFDTILFYEGPLCVIRDNNQYFMETYLMTDELILSTIEKLKNHLKEKGRIIIQVKNARNEKMRLNFKDDLVYHVKVDKFPDGKLKVSHFIDKGNKNISESVYDKYIMPIEDFEQKFIKGQFTQEQDFYLINL